MLTGSVKKHLKQAIPAYVILAAIIIIVSMISPTFRKVGNIRNIIAQTAVLAVVAIAQSNVLFIGGIDMSVSSIISFGTISVAMFSTKGTLGLVGSIALALGVGALTGLVNGIGVVRFRIPAMIITLSTQAFLKGICLILMPSSGGKVLPAFSSFLKTRFGVINMSAIIALILYAIFFVIYHYTCFGRRIYAIGNGERYAAQSGVPVNRTIILTYVISGVVSGIAGLLLAARISTGNPLVGDSYAMSSVASAVVGGIAMTGGIGTVLGSLAGAVIMQLINNVINNMDVSPYYQYITKGLVLVLSLLIFQLKRRKRV